MATNFENNRPAKAPVTLAADLIPMFSGRPMREKVIGREDLMDLDILLHTSETIEDFLKKL